MTAAFCTREEAERDAGAEDVKETSQFLGWAAEAAAEAEADAAQRVFVVWTIIAGLGSLIAKAPAAAVVAAAAASSSCWAAALIYFFQQAAEAAAAAAEAEAEAEAAAEAEAEAAHHLCGSGEFQVFF